MTPEAKRWIEAAKVLGADPAAKVKCPACDHEFLEVTDVYPHPGSEVFERYLQCPSCGRRNIMRMRTGSTPPPDSEKGR